MVASLKENVSVNFSAAIDFLSALVLAESPTDNVASQERPLGLMTGGLAAAGLTVERIKGTTSAGCLVARGPWVERPSQLLVGHSDTVWPIGTLEHMPLKIEEDVMCGPGVFDMKAGLTQMVFALKAIHDLGLEPPLNPVVLINTDEEIGSLDSKGFIYEMAKQAARAFVLEPPIGYLGKLKTARKGIAHYDISAHGRAAHAGLEPEKGVSAVVEMSHVVQTLHALNDLPGGLSVNVGVITGGSRGNVVPAECRIVVDVRAWTLSDLEAVDERIQTIRPVDSAVKLKIVGGINRPPMEKTPGNVALWHTAQRVAAELEMDLEEGTVGGGSDGNLTSLYTPTLDGLGTVGGGAHALDEHIILEALEERTVLLGALLMS